MRKILYNRQSECIQPLRALIERQKHRTMVAWAFDCSEKYLNIYETLSPEHKKLREAVEAAKKWAAGDIKMPEARRAILAAHKEVGTAEGCPEALAAGRAVAQAISSVHAETHALGLVFYGLTSLSHSEGSEAKEDAVNKELDRLYDRLLYWEENIDRPMKKWAAFLLRDNVPNKEKLLSEKMAKKKMEQK